MKNIAGTLLILAIALIWGPADTTAQPVNRSEAISVAGNYLNLRHPGQSTGMTEPLKSGSDTLAWLVNCKPHGFIIISNNTSLSPVIAWSEEGNFAEGEAWVNYLPVLMYDLKTRNEFIRQGTPEALANRQKWSYWMNPQENTTNFQQWPPEGWSSTGGWLFTNWTQSSPYNALCPIDGQTQVRSYAGCPATAMAQILNFQHNIHQTRFDDADDYYHNYGSGNSYWIDNDWENHGFPSWNQLNVYLDTLETHFQYGIPLSNTDMAALTFACGVAARQVYSSAGSGTFGVDQAYDAYVRFGYSDARLDGPLNPELNMQLAQNIMLALPAHLALVNPEWTVGHNVVVDGYNTDGLFHFNFGWGGSANGWYTMPPADIPYDLTVIEGIVLDINLSSPPVGTYENAEVQYQSTMNYSNETGFLYIRLPESSKQAILTVFDQTGKIVMQNNLCGDSGDITSGLPVKHLPKGLFIATMVTETGSRSVCKFIR